MHLYRQKYFGGLEQVLGGLEPPKPPPPPPRTAPGKVFRALKVENFCDILININNNNNNNIQFLETHNTIKNSLYACEKSKYQTEIMIFQN